MGDTRIRYGLAYGRMNNFYTGSTDQTTRGYFAGTDGLFKQADTTPDVTNGYLFYTNNSSATTISNFDLSHPATMGSTQVAGLFEGKVIRVFTLDSNTTIAGSRIYSAASDAPIAPNTCLEFIYHGSAWYEIDRSAAKEGSYTVNVAGSSSINADLAASVGASVVVLQGTNPFVVLKSISGGYIGQTLYISNGSASISYAVNTDGNISMINTNTLIIATSGGGGTRGVSVTKINSTQWGVAGGW